MFKLPIALFLITVAFMLCVGIFVPAERAVCVTVVAVISFLFLAYIIPAVLTYKEHGADHALFMVVTMGLAPMRIFTALLMVFVALHFFDVDPLKLGLAVYGAWLPVLCAEIWILSQLDSKDGTKT